ncbi:MAG: tryptophan synthase subunit alpha, partial [Candidatus Omnitrophica bacterium]|nr:tryptophan synthase subunit alpha [Candidatus Omnitrophota bacterium]
LMTYYNPVFCFGEERFLKLAKSSGVDGLIIADLPVEESSSILRLAKIYDLDIIFFISPTTSLKRAIIISKLASGFIYYISLTGVTGPRQRLPQDLIENLRRIKAITSKPICVGFGISNRTQLEKINRVADGVILGSIVIKKIKDNLNRADLVKRIGDFISSLKD